jgi:pimeloyl-ACP methyl ester carboxylesterase
MSIAKGGIRWKALLTTLGVVLLLPYLGILAWLKANESEMVFQTAMSRSSFPVAFPADVEPVFIPLAPGQPLTGYRVMADGQAATGFWILHLHGNADTVMSAGQAEHAWALREQGFHVLAFDYRGFGESRGEASEKNVYEDAEAAFQYLATQGVPSDRIILWGHSLGSGPAVELATRHQVAAVVLFGAFTSVPDRAAELYPWLPVRWIAGIRFDNLARLPSIRSPVVILHAETDRTIPISHGERLFAAAREPKRILRLEAQSDDGFGGHYAAAYEQLERVVPVVWELVGQYPRNGAEEAVPPLQSRE